MSIKSFCRLSLIALSVFSFTGGFSPSAKAQEGWQGQNSSQVQGRAAQREKIQQIFKDLNLNEEQKKEVGQIIQKNRPKIKELRLKTFESMKQLRRVSAEDSFSEQKVRSAHKDFAGASEDLAVERARMMSQIREVLNPQQKEKLSQSVRQMEERFKQEQSKFGRGNRGRDLEELDLTGLEA
ncbi:MAG: Spy/CpxP family protein refolding chaperone [Candidatus Caenarcaniphilales bacterium]|nr:Spy/CpxP family protein refolding chaperone [Candidatus Caenarcaniphilales bacterium]